MTLRHTPCARTMARVRPESLSRVAHFSRIAESRVAAPRLGATRPTLPTAAAQEGRPGRARAERLLCDRPRPRDSESTRNAEERWRASDGF